MQNPSPEVDYSLYQKIRQTIADNSCKAYENLNWLKEHMHHCFFLSNQDEVQAIADLSNGMTALEKHERITLCERGDLLMLAQREAPGSIHETMSRLPDRLASYTHIARSYATLPGTDYHLEVLRLMLNRKDDAEIAKAGVVRIPAEIRTPILEAFQKTYPELDADKAGPILRLLWLNNEIYVRISPPERVARIIGLYENTSNHGGIYLDEGEAFAPDGSIESRILFGVGNPPQKNFLAQILEVFKRLQIPIMRAYFLTVSNGVVPYVLCSIYVKAPGGMRIEKGTERYLQLKEELYNTQLLSNVLPSYERFVTSGVASGPEATLVNAFIGFCLTNLAHAQPKHMSVEDVRRAFLNHPDVSLQLIKLFKARFDPEKAKHDKRFASLLKETSELIENYNTGRRYIDEFRRDLFHCALLMIRYTLKTNYFVPEKHALAFRLDPKYLDELAPQFTEDLPAERPFRITYFFGRFGSGYHIGFSDIARGGWRTLIAQNRDDYAEKANTIFKENYVLAHTQHLKNKDIYEGGSKMVALLDAGGEEHPQAVRQRLYKLQYGFISAFLDIFVTENGKVKAPQVVDYYGEDEPIELGPDENMHDTMVEIIAKMAARRDYMLGAGIMSSKKIGINHKEYGVTSIGVIRFAEVAMAELGIDMHRDPFTVKFTGGPNGDVAGNCMRLIMERCPKAVINLVVDGTGALCDPSGLDRAALAKIILQQDLDGLDVNALNPGGFLLYRNQTKRDGVRELFKKVTMTKSGLEEQWVSNDEFYKEYNSLLFTVPADLFIPAGGRPETIHRENCHKFFAKDGTPSAKIIAEGANSFITPDARIELQRGGVMILRDASVNKCGVISSSYEIIANLMMSDKEFLSNKSRYVKDVIAILNRRAEDEARLLLRRHKSANGTLLYTEISDGISKEINTHYARLFDFFQARPELASQPIYQKTIQRHLPAIVANEARFRKRIKDLPVKIKAAILASETASSMVYCSNGEEDYLQVVEDHLSKMLRR